MSVQASASWTARPATVADRPDQVRLFNDCFRKQKDEQTFAWKYERNPDGPAIARVAVDAASAQPGRGTVVGAYAYMPRRFLRDGKPVLLMQAADAMTDAGWRGRGVFTGLDAIVAKQAGEQGVPLAFASCATAGGSSAMRTCTAAAFAIGARWPVCRAWGAPPRWPRPCWTSSPPSATAGDWPCRPAAPSCGRSSASTNRSIASSRAARPAPGWSACATRAG
jgi:hypothetical protein